MRKTPHNPKGFERHTWGYRLLQIRHALGWTRAKLSRVSGISIRGIEQIETGLRVRAEIETIRKIKAVEEAYADIIKEYKKAPVRLDRLRQKYRKGGVYLLPIAVRRPEDLDTLGKVEADSTELFYGRGTRRRMQQIGMSMQRKIRELRLGEARSRLVRQRDANGRYIKMADKEIQPGQSNDEGRDETGLD